MIRQARCVVWALVAGLGLSTGALAYPDSKSAHAACDPKGVQYDASNKQFCCGTKGGCPNPLVTHVDGTHVLHRVDDACPSGAASTATGAAAKACTGTKKK